MTGKSDALKKVLRRHGVDDAAEYLEKRGASVKVARSVEPDVYMRGSVQLMMNRKKSRAEVEKELGTLQHL